MAVIFSNPDTAAKYEAARENDCKVHVPAGKTKTGGYSGMLSGITPEAAAKAVASGSNLLKEKSGNKNPASTKTEVKPKATK